jgi:hypothetical protein
VGAFPFADSAAFGYPECVNGLLAALESAHAAYPIPGVVTWGVPAWKHLRDSDRRIPKQGIIAAALSGGAQGFAWQPRKHLWRIHPFPHILPSKRHLNWKSPLMDAYRGMWTTFLSASWTCLAGEKGGKREGE